MIEDFLINQDSEDYGDDTRVIIQFQTMNPVSYKGVILLKWPANVVVYDQTYCKVTTHKLILRDICTFNLDERTLTIENAFAEVPPSYTGLI